MPVADKTAKEVVKHGTHATNAARAAANKNSLFGSALESSNSVLNTAQMGLFLLPMLSGVLGFIGKAPLIGSIFKKASGVVEAPTKFAEQNTVASALDKAHDQVTKVISADKLEKVGDIAKQGVNKLESAAGKADNYISGVSKGFSFAKNKIAKGMTNVRGMTVHDAIYKGSIHAGSALLAYHNIKATRAGLSTLKDMCQDLTGKRPSTWSVLFGNVPDSVKEIRSQFIKTSIVRTIADVIGIGASTRFARNNNMGPKELVATIGIQMGTSMLSSFITNGNNSADMYATMKDTQAAGQPLPAEMIAQFIGMASKSAKAAGGPENQAVQILAKKYSAEGLSAEQILAKVNSGEIDQDRAGLKSLQVTQSRVQNQAKAPAAAAQTNPSAVGTHTNRFLQQQQAGMGMPFAVAGAGR